MVNEHIEQRILALYSERKWDSIVNLNFKVENVEQNRLFWVLPTMDDLQWMRKVIKKYDMGGVVSIGCGCGLLEWLFQSYTGLDVIGVELDQSWWHSKYAPPLFLENIQFIQEKQTQNYRIDEKYALLFCYFNNAAAFRTYMQNYNGHLVLVIGPAEGEERSTDPLPLDDKFYKHGWKLIDKKRFGRSNDLIAAYTR